jgi:hypothetical protein
MVASGDSTAALARTRWHCSDLHLKAYLPTLQLDCAAVSAWKRSGIAPIESKGMVTTLVAVALVIVLLVLWWIPFAVRAKRFSRRPILSFDEWYDRYYANTGLRRDLVAKVVNAFAGEVGVEPTSLQPTDRLDTELAVTLAGVPFDDAFELAELAIAQLVRETTRSNLPNAETWETLDDVVRGVCGFVQRAEYAKPA